MPDDQVNEVAEQAIIEEPDEKDEMDAFASDDDGLETGLEKREETEKEPEKKTDKKDESEKSDASDDEESDDEPEEESEDEEDEDLKRGKEILEQQRQADEEKKAAEEGKDKDKDEDDEPYDIMAESFTDKDVIEKFVPSIPPNLFPKKPVELEDGTQLDFQSALKDYPEMPVMIQMLVNNQIRQMMGNGFLVGGDQYGKDKGSVIQGIEQRFFRHTVFHPQFGVPEAKEIIKSDEYKKWIEKQPDEIKALRSTGNPWDFIRVLKRFQNKEITADAKKDAAEKDEKRKKDKEKIDGAFKKEKSAKAKPKKSGKGIGTKDDEMEAFLSDEDDEMY